VIQAAAYVAAQKKIAADAAAKKKTSAWKEYWKAEGPKLGQFALQQIEAASKPKPDEPLRRGYVERVGVEAQKPVPMWMLLAAGVAIVGLIYMQGRRRG
jgi:hypothetical protein